MAWMLCLIFWIKSELKTSRTIIRRLLLLYLLICSKVKNPLEQPHKMSLIHWTRIQLADSYARHGPLSHLTGQNWQSEDIRRKFRTKKMTIFKNNQIFDDWISHTVHCRGSSCSLYLSLPGSVGRNVPRQFRCSHLVKFPSYLLDHVNLSCTVWLVVSKLGYILLGY